MLGFPGPLGSTVVVILTVHAFPTPAQFVSLHRMQIPRNQREDNAADYWRVHGKVLPRALRAVAQSVFGCSAAARVVERDFCIEDMLMPRRRDSLDSFWVNGGKRPVNTTPSILVQFSVLLTQSVYFSCSFWLPRCSLPIGPFCCLRFFICRTYCCPQ